MNGQDSAKQGRFRASLAEAGLDALLVTRDANQRWLEGWTGTECYLLASAAGSWLVADSRYTEQAAEECRSAKVVQHRDPCPPYDEVIARLAAEAGFRRIGFEKTQLSFAQYDAIRTQLGKAGGAALVPTDGIVEKLRMEKSPSEIDCLRRACTAADRALELTLKDLREGMSELELARELESRMADAGADGPGFETIAAFGKRPSMPHAVPSAQVKLAKGDFILLDFGALAGGYRSDITRTVVFGKASAEQKNVYAAVLASQLASVEAMAVGASGKVPDAVARERIAAAGYPVFGYGVGHGVGLEIHELPFMSKRCEEVLAAGMVITNEPGIYVPGWGGVRIEDSVLVRPEGPECLTRFPKDRLLEL
ncbi:MAG TPA: Xaa-Pro peptidase family protein [Spirochaetales bacterium]|nr:Xaa-Pro peptidase family protein [Spirochaetales bacterium]HRY52981.1 Xaa-Pro peptidase family protein [Spirochaetia bacterium]